MIRDIGHDLLLEKSNYMTFKDFYNTYHYNESSFIIIDDNQDLNILEKFLNSIIDFIDTINDIDILRMMIEPKWFFEQTIRVKEKEIKVKIGNFQKNPLYYDVSEKTIYLDLTILTLSKDEAVINNIMHEIGHSLSIRITPEILNKIRTVYSPKFWKMIDELNEKLKQGQINKKQHTERISIARTKQMEEFDAEGTAIATHLIKEYKKDPKIKEILLSWLRRKCHPDEIPDVLLYWSASINIWNSKPRLYKKFVDRIFNLISKTLK